MEVIQGAFSIFHTPTATPKEPCFWPKPPKGFSVEQGSNPWQLDLKGFCTDLREASKSC